MNDRDRQQARKAEHDKYNQKYFEHHYWAEDLPGKSGNRGLSYDDPDHILRFSHIADTLVGTFNFDSILDAGCGTGILLPMLADRGKNVTGVDISSAAREVYTRQTSRMHAPTFLLSPLHELPFPDDHFDLVWCSDVLEHIPIFDIPRSIGELIRVSRSTIALTINLDNPYDFHPTILPKSLWEEMFTQSKAMRIDRQKESILQNRLTRKYPEYDAFVFTCDDSQIA
ncbi:MAG: class I SAM-dependent methyltransferase [Phycisphaerales bacterium]